MDALEFIRERNRMCRTFDKSCDGCPAYENGWECDNDAWDETPFCPNCGVKMDGVDDG